MQTETTNNSVMVESLGSKFKLRFDDEVTCPSYYRFEIEALSQAQQNDQVSITINTDGGSLATGIEVANAIFDCKAEVEGVLRSSCHSCGSIIFLACMKHDVGLASSMLLHAGAGGTYGTPNQSIERSKSYKRQVRELFETIYKGFLSAEELDKMIDEDKEFIFSGEEIVPRLESMYSYRENVQNEHYQEQDDLLWDENVKMVEEAIGKLDISQEDKDTFNRVKDLLDEELQTEDIPKYDAPSVEEDGEVPPDSVIHQWTEDVAVILTYTPDGDNTMLVCGDEYLLIDEDSMLADRDGVIFFLQLVTDMDISRKKSTKSLIKTLTALVSKFISKTS